MDRRTLCMKPVSHIELLELYQVIYLLFNFQVTGLEICTQSNFVEIKMELKKSMLSLTF